MSGRSQPEKRQANPGSTLRTIGLAALVLAAAVLPYARTLDFEFVWDDPHLVGPHLDLHGVGDVARLWNTPFDQFLKDMDPKRTYFRPASLLSLAVDRAISGDDPRGYHRTNVILGALASLFLWLAAWELSGRPLASAAGAVLFALHPTHPESVAFVSGRTDLLCAASLFAALWASLSFGRRIQRPWLKLLPATLLLLPGLFAKEIGLFVAPLLPLALWVRDRRLTLADTARAAVPVAAACILYLACRILVLGPNPIPTIAPVQGATAQLLTSVAVVARYIPLLFFPIHLSARHEIPETRSPDALFLAGLLILALIGSGLLLAARRRSPWLVPLGLYAATLLPVCIVRIIAGALVAERFLYVPSGAVAFAAALLPGALAARDGTRGRSARRTRARESGDAGPGFLLGVGAAAVVFAILLLPRVAIWKNEGTLYLSMLRDSPGSPHVHAMLGSYYYRMRDLPRAAYHHRIAYALRPTSPELLLDIGAVEDEMGETDSAFTHIRLLNRLAPRYAPGYYALGNLFVRVDRPDSAAAAYRTALYLMPRLPQAENNLGAVLERMGRREEALAHYRSALAIDPAYQDARNNLKRLSAEP